MKQFTTVFFVVVMAVGATAQTYEIGPLVGGMNYIGDVGRTNYIAPNSLGFGGVFKWNRSARHSFRASVLFGKIKGDDADASDPRREQRGLSFENNNAINITENPTASKNRVTDNSSAGQDSHDRILD